MTNKGVVARVSLEFSVKYSEIMIFSLGHLVVRLKSIIYTIDGEAKREERILFCFNISPVLLIMFVRPPVTVL